MKYGGTRLRRVSRALGADGAEQTTSGYSRLEGNRGSISIRIWNTDSSGNYRFEYLGPCRAATQHLESLETSFHQDLNGDGAIGVAPAP